MVLIFLGEMKPKDADSKFSRAAQRGSSSLKTAAGGKMFLCGR